VLINIS